MGKTCGGFPRLTTMADHPHGRGENFSPATQRHIRAGPSPRAWGKPSRRAGRSDRRRTIPTGVGKTGFADLSNTSTRTIPTGVGKTHNPLIPFANKTDHPHGRGENKSSKDFDCGVHGPSPRAWGKLRIHHQLRPIRRTIPTGVGKTPVRCVQASRCADHPHGRGENLNRTIKMKASRGPSPRAWGKRMWREFIPNLSRTIPTGVGKTNGCTYNGNRIEDHPHGRGENEMVKIQRARIYGPSPRAWGKRFVLLSCYASKRTIPTGVGKTNRGGDTQKSHADHPHGRGENSAKPRFPPPDTGPSPRAWGKHSMPFPCTNRFRTIPTGVGKTDRDGAPVSALADHPHGRGENDSQT